MYPTQAHALYRQLREDGFAIVRNVLSETETKQLRQTLKEHFWEKGDSANYGLVQANAAIEIPSLDWVFYHPHVLNAVRMALGCRQVVFTSHCDAHVGTLARWHKDDGPTGMPGSYFGQTTYDQPDCCVYKVAIYLQDHSNNLGGLSIRQGSHRSASLNLGKSVYLDTRLGDIAIFDVRSTHRGQMSPAPGRLAKRVISWLQITSRPAIAQLPAPINISLKKAYCAFEQERMGIFFTFGFPNHYTYAFATANMRRQMVDASSKEPFVSKSLRQALEENEVLLAEDLFAALNAVPPRYE
jgi:hypothetical protein